MPPKKSPMQEQPATSTGNSVTNSRSEGGDPKQISKKLLQACTSGGKELVKALVQQLQALEDTPCPGGGLWINFKPDGDETALHCACRAKYRSDGEHIECVKILVEAGANPDAVDLSRHTPLYHADERRSDLLIQAGCNVNHTDREGRTVLYHEVRHQQLAIPDLDKVILLLNAGADPTIVAADGSVSLFRASVNCLPHLLAHGVNPDFPHKEDRRTPLLDLCSSPSGYTQGEFERYLATLVIAGANPNATIVAGGPSTTADARWLSRSRLGVLHLVADDEDIEFLVSLGANVNLGRCTPLFRTCLLASRSGGIRLELYEALTRKAKALLRYGANPNCVAIERTPLMMAARRAKEGEDGLLGAVLDGGAEVNLFTGHEAKHKHPALVWKHLLLTIRTPAL